MATRMDIAPRVTIDRQPSMQTRFRYESETYKGLGDVVQMKLLVENYTGDFDVRIDLVGEFSDEEHVNTLEVHKEAPNCSKIDDRTVRLQCTNRQQSCIHTIPRLVIVRKKPEPAENSAAMQSAESDRNAVRYRFTLEWADGRQAVRLFSDIVVNNRSAHLDIIHVNPPKARYNVTTDVTVLCSGVTKHTKVVFESEGQQRWREEACSVLTHKFNALVIQAPRYPFKDGGTVKVYLVNNGRRSGRSLPFIYAPEERVGPESLSNRDRTDPRRLMHDGAGSAKRPRHEQLVVDAAVDESQEESESSTAISREILFGLAAGDFMADAKLTSLFVSHRDQLQLSDDFGYTALATAIVMGSFPFVKAFLENISETSASAFLSSHLFSELYLSYFHLFAYCQKDTVPFDLFRLALNAGFSPVDRDDDGNTFLHLLVIRERFEDLKTVLLEPGLPQIKSSLDHLNNADLSALHEAVVRNQAGTVSVLLKAGANPNLPSKRTAVTPFHLALLYKRNDCAKEMLTMYEADVNRATGDGKTPMDIAMEGNNKDLEQELRRRGGTNSPPSDTEGSSEMCDDDEDDEDEDEEMEDEHEELESSAETANSLPLTEEEIEAEFQIFKTDTERYMTFLSLLDIKESEKNLLRKLSSPNPTIVQRMTDHEGLCNALVKLRNTSKLR